MTPGHRTWLRRIAALFAGLALLLLLVVGIFAIGTFSVDAQRLREPVDAALTRALGREVEIAGPARLTLSFQPTLVVQDVRIANPAGFPDPGLGESGFATIAELRLDTELLPLLRQRLIVRELRGSDVVVRLARANGGRGNWIFESEPKPGDADSPSRFTADWRRLVFERAVVEYVLADKTRSLQLDSLVIEGLTGQQVQLLVQGKAGALVPFQGKAGSAPLKELAGEKPWPFTTLLKTLQTVASIDGSRLYGPDGLGVRLRADIKTSEVNEIEELLGISLPVAGAATLSGELEISAGLARLRNFSGQMGDVTFSGEATVDNRGPRPRLHGQLTLPEIQIEGLASSQPADEEGSATLAALYAAFQETELHLSRLAHFDADFGITIGRLVDSPGDVQDVTAMLQLDSGQLLVPFTATIGGASIKAELSADASSGTPGFGLSLTTRDAPFGGLALLLFDLPHVEGTVQSFSADFSASGRKLAELVQDLEARIDIERAQLSYGNYVGGRPVDLRITSAEVAQARGQTLAATAKGSLRGKPFEGSFGADTLEYLLRERQTPFHFAGRSGGARLNLSGVLAEPDANSGPDIKFDLSAPQAGELAPWLGFSSQSTDPVALGGRVLVQENGTRLVDGSLVFGRSSIKGDLDWQRRDGRTHIEANLAAELLAPAELRGLRDAPAAQQRAVVDLPILPETLDFGDTDLELTVQAIHGLALEVTEIKFSGRMRDSAIEPSPFSVLMQGNELSGTLALDTRGPSTTASLALAGEAFDTGAVLRQLGLAQDIDGQIGKLQLQVDARGSLLGEVLGQTSFLATFEAGTLSYFDAGTQSIMDLALSSGELRADADGPIRGAITGNAGDVPVRIELEAGPLSQLLPPSASWPFSISASFADALWVISGSKSPGPTPATEVSLSLDGGRLDQLDTLFATSLPPWGPYRVTGSLHFARNSYRVEDLRLTVGSSELLGSGSLDTGASPPRLDTTLLAPLIQLYDFPLGDWSPLPPPGSGPAERMTTRSARRALAAGVEAVHPLFGRERLELGNAQVEISVERMLAGKDELGTARLAASISDGAATLGPIEIDGRSGRAKVAVSYEPRDQDMVFSARAVIDRLDYGLVATRFDPVSGINGVFSLDLAVDSVAPELNRLMQTASGHIDLAIWPDRLRWGGFDLWAANLMRSLLPFFSPTASHINCVIGHFDLAQGLLESRGLLVDTTNTRAAGWARADFTTERLRMRFVPRHKQPRLVSLAIPVEVRGTFDDYRISLRPTDALGRVAQWFKTLVMVPLHWFGVGRIPRDGSDVCTEPERQ